MPLAKNLIEAAGNATQATYIEDVFSTYLYTGNDSTQNIVNGIDLSTKGGMVWLKGRSLAVGHYLYDTVRGIANGPLSSENTSAAYTANTPKTLTSFNTDGFSMQDDSASFGANVSPRTQVSWTFRKQPKFYTQELINHTNGTATNIDLSTLGTVGYLHAKITNTTGDWIAWHRSLTAGNNLRLNTTAAQSTTNAWLSVSGTTATLSASAPTGSYIIHAFAHDAGGFGLTGTDNVISCGSFTPDGSGNATIDLGWEPQWLLRKTYNNVGDWEIRDSMRNFSMSSSALLYPSYSLAETTGAAATFIPTATGFKYVNGGTEPMIYIAIRRGPMKVPTDGTKVFSPVTGTGTGAAATVTGVGFTPDFLWSKPRNTGGALGVHDRLRGTLRELLTNSTAVEYNDPTSVLSINMDGYSFGTDASGSGTVNASGSNYVYWNFRRAPSFFDEVCYTGTGTVGQTFSHNLGVAPELMIVKCRSTTGEWRTYSSALTATKWVVLNTTAAAVTGAIAWNNTEPTSSVFSVGNSSTVNGSGVTYVAYLFATCPGVSKVGSYTGTGTTQQINCGFAAGARFVLIKRTDSTGDWYVWDSARGIVAGNNPYIVNRTAVEVTSTDYVDTYSAGFELSSTAPAALNASGGSFIFFAVA